MEYNNLKPVPEITTVGACVINNLGRLLPYTMQSCVSQCEEYQEANNPLWEAWKSIGCKVVSVEIKIIDDYYNRLALNA